MKKASTTNKNLIFFGSLLVIVAALSIAFMSNRDKPNYEVSLNDYTPIEGAIANSYEVPNEVKDITEYDTVIGNGDAKLKVVVYEDYSNQYNAELDNTLNQLVQENQGQLAIISRPFVLTNSTDSQQSVLSYLCAKDLGRATEMRSLLFKQVREDVMSHDFVSYATELGINEEDFVSCLTNEEKLVQLEMIKNDAKANMILGAPTMLVGSEMILGARPYSDFVDSNGDAIEGLKTVVSRQLDISTK